MDITTSIAGVDRLAATLRAAGADLVDLSQVNQDAGDLVVASADIPYRTGALNASTHAIGTEAGVDLVTGGPGAPYGPKVHARSPFLTDALTAKESDVIDLYVDHAERVVDTIEGA